MGNSVVKFLTTETMLWGGGGICFTFIERALEKYILVYVGFD